MHDNDFRAAAHAAVDLAADYLRDVEDHQVLAQVAPGEVRAGLPGSPPVTGESMDAILADIERVVIPGLTHWNHPGFMAYFAITGSAPGIIGELLTAAFNVNGMLWRTSPVATELEQVTLDWLRQLLGVDDAMRGVIMDTASMATLTAIAAARDRALPDARARGLGALGVRPRVYASEQAHSSVQKAAVTLGLGLDGVRTIATDDEFRMDVDALAAAVAEDRREGWVPMAVHATVGTTASTSIDPVPEIARVCADEGLWLHVDGAYAGIAAIVPELRHVLAGVEHADSLVVNPHKWLFTPIDCSAFYVRDPDALKRAFSLVPEYLRTTDVGVENYMDWGVQLGRRFRALKLWMVMRSFGADGLIAAIREHLRLAQVAADWVDASQRFERVAPVPFSVVNFRARFGVGAEEEDRRNLALIDAVNARGRVYLSHVALRGRTAIHLAIGNLRTTEAHVIDALELLDTEAARLASG